MADVVVVGAGPAGSVTALLLARSGLDVLVLDRARFPRPKPCGECVNPGAVALLEGLGLASALEGARLRGWRLRTDDADVAADFGSGLHGVGISRMTFDAALVEAARRAGARVQEGTRVLSVEAAPGAGGRPLVGLQGGATLRPRVVVGADGLRSVVVRSLRLLARRPRLVKLSLTTHVRAEDPESELPVDHGLLHLTRGLTLGVAPLGGGRWNATVVGDPRVHGPSVAADPRAFVMAVLRRRVPGAVVEAGPWASGPFDWPVRRAWAPGVALVGDAAGYYDPFTGQGIYRALRTAELAAEAVVEALTGAPGWAPLARYHRRWRRESRWNRMVQRGVERIMSDPTVRGHVLRRLHAARGLGTVIRVTGDVAPPSTLLDPRVWLGGTAARRRPGP